MPASVRRLRRRRSSGAERTRTANLLVANQALSQLSYGPPVRGQRRAGLDPAMGACVPDSTDRSARSTGPGWIRTNDLTVISGVLCQLSYEPASAPRRVQHKRAASLLLTARLRSRTRSAVKRFEPTGSYLSSIRAKGLSSKCRRRRSGWRWRPAHPFADTEVYHNPRRCQCFYRRFFCAGLTRHLQNCKPFYDRQLAAARTIAQMAPAAPRSPRRKIRKVRQKK